MKRMGWQAVVGVTIGVAAALLIKSAIAPAAQPAGAMLGEYGGPIKGVVMQYASPAPEVLQVYQQFLAKLPEDAAVTMICADGKARDELRQGLGETLFKRLDVVVVNHVMTPWSRDRWYAEAMATGSTGITTIVPPCEELAAGSWRARAGDALLAADLQRNRPAQFRMRRSLLAFDAGDFLADGRHVFVSPSVLLRNMQRTAHTRDQLAAQLERELGHTPVLLEHAPLHHVGMYMMSAGRKRMVVGDPSLANKLLGDARPDSIKNLPGGPNFSDAMQKQFDSVAEATAKAGFEVVRIPCVPSHDKPYITYVNVILDDREGAWTVYMPVYDGLEAINDAAAATWQAMGWRVERINCTGVYHDGGTLHCLVNVYARG